MLVFGLQAITSLATLLQLAPPTLSTPHFSIKESNVTDLSQTLSDAARTALFDPALGVFVSGPARQVSWASQAWAVIAGIPESLEQGALALRTAYADPEAVKGTTPYLHHYVRPPALPRFHVANSRGNLTAV